MAVLVIKIVENQIKYKERPLKYRRDAVPKGSNKQDIKRRKTKPVSRHQKTLFFWRTNKIIIL